MNKETKDFRCAYDQLPSGLKREIRRKIMKNVFYIKSTQSFYNKKNGREGITAFEWSEVKKVFAEYGINAETGELIECPQI